MRELVLGACDNTVFVTDANKNPHTTIGDSDPRATVTYCSPAGKHLPDQVTGCINPSHLHQLVAGDDGGQYDSNSEYDSSGGANSQGNPQGSICLGYKHYMELIEPGTNHACIRCCGDATDCLLDNDTQGCSAVISGNFFNCS
ncbi:hypothetical protein L208DRAFT_1537449 [Tricholoma matsutake]|nr:hypothetical protein L208DRAFT_1537449 [Tricholoma matsutake 945]